MEGFLLRMTVTQLPQKRSRIHPLILSPRTCPSTTHLVHLISLNRDSCPRSPLRSPTFNRKGSRTARIHHHHH